MRRILAVSLLAAAVLAGCAGTTTETSTSSTGPAAAGWHLDCMLGSYERALSRNATGNMTWPQDCVARASHTPATKAEMWLAINPTNPNNVVVGSKDKNPEMSQACVWNG